MTTEPTPAGPLKPEDLQQIVKDTIEDFTWERFNALTASLDYQRAFDQWFKDRRPPIELTRWQRFCRLFYTLPAWRRLRDTWATLRYGRDYWGY